MCAVYKGLGIVCLASVVVSAGPASAAVIANFADGNDNTATVNPGVNAPTADSFKGAANAGGWATSWSQTTTGTIASNSTQVLNTTPLTTGSDNYLNLNYTGSASGAAVHEVRQYANTAGGVDTTAEHAVSFQFRLDSALSNRSLTDSNDFVRFYDNTSAAGTGSTATSWQIVAAGAAGQTDGVHFRLGAGDGGAAGGQTSIDTGILLAQNTVYSISVDVHPVTGTFNAATNFPTWDATISDGVHTFTQTGLRFRDNALTSGRFLQFGGGTNGANEQLSMSIDNLQIANTPEPTAVGLLAMAGTMLLRRRRR